MWSILAVLIGLAMGGVIAARAFLAAGTIPDNIGGFTWPKIYLGASGVAVLFLLIKLINHSGDIAFGFLLGIICVAAICAGSFLQFQEERGVVLFKGAGPSAPAITCPACGVSVPKGAKFCKACGADQTGGAAGTPKS